MDHIDPIKPHHRIEPLFFPRYGKDNSEQPKKDQPSDFDLFLEDAIDDTDSFPDDLEASFKKLKKLIILGDKELHRITMNFNRYGLQLIHDVNFRLSPQSFEIELIEKEIIKVSNVLFILIVHYGVIVALNALLEFWHSVKSNQVLDKKIKGYLLYIAKFDLPLLPFENGISEPSKAVVIEKIFQLKYTLKESLIHHFTEERTRSILDEFKE